MNQEFEIRNLINEATEGVITDEEPFELLDLNTRVIPYLAECAVQTADDNDREILEKVKEMLALGDIGVAVRAIHHQTDGKVADIELNKMREPSLDEGYTLRFLVNPTVTYSLESADDFGRSVEKMKDIMIVAYSTWKELVENRTFVPVRETW